MYIRLFSFLLFLDGVKVEMPSPGSIESDLKALLLKLPLSGLDPCTIWFTRNAILTGKSGSQHRRVSCVFLMRISLIVLFIKDLTCGLGQ